MQNIRSETDLRDAIIQLEVRQGYEEILLKEQFHVAYESVKPVSLIRGIIKDAAGSQGLKDDLLSTSVGLGAGYLSKILFQGVTRNPIKKILGTALMFGITQIVARNPEVVRSIGKGFFKMIRSKSAKKDI